MSRNYGGSMVANMFLKFGADTSEFQKKMRASVTRMLFAAESLTQAGRIMSTAITAPMMAIGAISLKTAMQFEESMTKMEALVGMPADVLARWKPVIQNMAGVVGKSANELAQALFFITSNGIRTDAALRVLEATAKAAAVGMGETKDIAIAATSAMNAYGKGAMTADLAVATLIGTVREGNLEAAELPQALAKLLPIAAAMGIEFHEAGAGIAAMSRSGTSARLAAFGLRAIMIGILDPTVSAAAAMAKVDLSAAKLKEVLAGPQGLRDAMVLFDNAVKSGKVTLKQLLPNQKAFSAALQLMGKSSEDYIKISNEMAKVVGEDVNDAFEKGAGKMARTYAQAMGKLSSAAIDLGDNMAPLIDNFAKLAQKVSNAARAYNELNDTQKGLIDSFALFAIAIGPVTYAIGSLSRILARGMGMSILLNAPWVKAAAGFGMVAKSTSIWTTSLSTLGLTLPVVGAALGTFLVSYNLSKWLDDAVGTTKALNEEFGRFGTSVKTISDEMAEGGERMELHSDQSHALALKIGEVALANELMDARIKGNYRSMGALVTAIDEAAQAYTRAQFAAEDLRDSEQDAADKAKEAIDEVAAEEAKRLKQLRERHNLMTSNEVTDKMNEMSGYYQDHINDGVQQGMINKEFVDDWKDLLALAREYGIATSKSFKDIGISMNETGDLENNELHKLWDYYIPLAIKKIPGEVEAAVIEIEKSTGSIEENTAGGMGRGFAKGLETYANTYRPQLVAQMEATYQGGFAGMGDELRDQVVNMVNLISPLELDVIPNKDVFNNAMNEILAGNFPDTKG